MTFKKNRLYYLSKIEGEDMKMNQTKIYKALYIASVLLIILFFACLGMDYFNYDTSSNSAPFYAFILERGLEFILPSILVFILGVFLRKKRRNNLGFDKKYFFSSILFKKRN